MRPSEIAAALPLGLTMIMGGGKISCPHLRALAVAGEARTSQCITCEADDKKTLVEFSSIFGQRTVRSESVRLLENRFPPRRIRKNENSFVWRATLSTHLRIPCSPRTRDSLTRILHNCNNRKNARLERLSKHRSERSW